MRMKFKLEKETKNYFKYRQEGGINALYLPKPEGEGTPALEQEFEIDVPEVTLA